MNKPAKKKAPIKPRQSLEAPKAPPMDAAISRVMAERNRKITGKKRT
jgi:hypothetical protein